MVALTPRWPNSSNRWLWFVLIAVACAGGVAAGYEWAARRTLPATVTVRIAEADLDFDARLDTGATISSINAHAIEVVGGAGKPQFSDRGKQVRFTLKNASGKQARVAATIDQVRGILSSDCEELRYHVYLTVNYAGTNYRILMNLNDRSRSRDKLLLGRNWLDNGFAVDVTKS